MEVAARPADPADLPRIAELATGAVEELRTHKGGAMWARREARRLPVDEELEEQVAGTHAFVLAGTIDGVVVGYGVVRLGTTTDGAEVAELTDLYVEPPARGVGVGEELLDGAIGWARERGCVGIDALVLPGDREAKNFFEAAGMTARAIVVHRSLDDS